MQAIRPPGSMSWIMQIRNPSSLKDLDDVVRVDNTDRLSEVCKYRLVRSSASKSRRKWHNFAGVSFLLLAMSDWNFSQLYYWNIMVREPGRGVGLKSRK